MRKGITPVVAIVILLIIALGVVGLAYGFISGIIGTATGKAAFISGSSRCALGVVTIDLTNVGTQSIIDADVIITQTLPAGGTSAFLALDPTTIAPNEIGSKTENAAGGFICGPGIICTYDVRVGPISYPTRAAC